MAGKTVWSNMAVSCRSTEVMLENAILQTFNFIPRDFPPEKMEKKAEKK